MNATTRSRKALLVVDMQPDFMEGGALPTQGGSQILDRVGRLMADDDYSVVAATQDWHPPDHISFASQHSGRQPFEVIQLHGHDQVLWPDHCVQGQPGSVLHPALPWERAAVIVRKGQDREVDSYSGFRNNWNARGERPATGLAGYLRERGVTDVDVCGLARDYCVLWTAEDAAAAGYHTRLIWPLTRPVDAANDNAVRDACRRSDIEIVEEVAA
jgi:nicotinamidase/pyrazinamidase